MIEEVEDAEALDLVLAWGFQKEYACSAGDGLEDFLNNMCNYLKQQMAEPTRQAFSDWVTWGSWPWCDSLYSEPFGWPADVSCLDFRSYNAYPYWREHVRDHQGGHGTGTPFAGYLAALKEYLHDKPLLISETGLSDCPTIGGEPQPRLKP